MQKIKKMMETGFESSVDPESLFRNGGYDINWQGKERKKKKKKGKRGGKRKASKLRGGVHNGQKP